MLLSALVFTHLLLPQAAPAPALAQAKTDYVNSVSDRVNAATWSEAQVLAALGAIRELAKIDDPLVLDLLATDSTKAGERLLDLRIKSEEKKLEVEQKEKKLADLTGDARTDAEKKLKTAQDELKESADLLKPLGELAQALDQALLDVTSKVAEARPAEVFDALLKWVQEDGKSYFDVDQRVRQLDAQLRAIKEKLPAAKVDDRPAIEKQGAEVAARLESARSDLARLDALRKKRFESLGKAFPKLDKKQSAKVQSDMKSALKDDTPFEKRAFYTELLGWLGQPDAATQVVAVMKAASKQDADLEKQVEGLRETHERALKALQVSAIGGNGQVPQASVNAEVAARNKVYEVTRAAFGELRVLDAAATALSSALLKMDDAARTAASAELVKAAVTGKDKLVRSRIMTALGAVHDDAVAAELRNVVLKDPDVQLRLAALDALTTMGDEPTVDLCITQLLKQTEWRIRAAAMRTLVKLPRKEAVPALIESLAAEVGRLIDDAEAALGELTGQHFNGDVALWRDWWEKNQGTFDIQKARAAAAKTDDAAKAEPGADWRKSTGHVSFYGISTRSNRILFVLDKSGSMNEPVGTGVTGAGSEKKIDAAKLQLKQAITSLQDGEAFNIVVYSFDVDKWQKQMQKMSPAVRKKVESYIDKDITAVGGTNIHDALREAFQIAGLGSVDKAYESNVDTIFFLTDGNPTVGETTDSEEILRRVRDWNKLSRIVIHTVAVGKDADQAFLRRLAMENGGQFTSR